MNPATETIKPPPATVGPIGWLRRNLFNTWYNAVLTLFALWIIYVALTRVVTWILFSADWSPITLNLKLFMVGQYPAEALWRIGLCVALVSFLFGVSWGVWGGTVRSFALAIAIGLGAPALLPVGLDVLSIQGRLWLLANPAAVILGFFVARTPLGKPRRVLTAWILSFFVTMIMLHGFQGSSSLPLVGTGVWGGLLLTFLLALIGIVASFPMGVLLALGRRSGLPVVKLFSILFIELVRGVPLVSILFMAQIILPLFLPEDIRVDRVLRALLAMTLFSAAYMAENVRGGLQAVPEGQVEAAQAIGLSGPLTMLLIILPQALRAVIPAIVGQFISLFKDTTLAVIVGLLEILGIGKAIILGNVKWIGQQTEVYLFIALVFWVFTYSMSYASRKLETALGVGER